MLKPWLAFVFLSHIFFNWCAGSAPFFKNLDVLVLKFHQVSFEYSFLFCAEWNPKLFFQRSKLCFGGILVVFLGTTFVDVFFLFPGILMFNLFVWEIKFCCDLILFDSCLRNAFLFYLVFLPFLQGFKLCCAETESIFPYIKVAPENFFFFWFPVRCNRKLFFRSPNFGMLKFCR